MPSYADWPLEADVQLLLDSCGVTTRLSAGNFTTRVTRIRGQVSGQVARRTHRQFVADSSDTQRYYDGSGGAELEVDEMVSLTSVQVIGLQSDPGYTIDNALLCTAQAIPNTRIIVAQGSLPAYATNAAFLPYRTIFPVGRQNILVTGKFGFASTIPVDLWEAACGEMAYLLSQEVVFTPSGRVSEERIEGAVTNKYQLDGADLTQWHRNFTQALQDYRRPAGRKLRSLTNRMI